MAGGISRSTKASPLSRGLRDPSTTHTFRPATPPNTAQPHDPRARHPKKAGNMNEKTNGPQHSTAPWPRGEGMQRKSAAWRKAQRGQQGAGAAGRPTKAKGRRHTERQATSPRSLKQQKAKRKKPAAQRGNRGAAQRERAASVSRQSNTAQEGQRRRPTGRHGAQQRIARAADRTAAPSARPSPPNPAGPVVLRVGAHGRGRGGGGGGTEEGGTQARGAPNQTQKGGWGAWGSGDVYPNTSEISPDDKQAPPGVHGSKRKQKKPPPPDGRTNGRTDGRTDGARVAGVDPATSRV